MGRILISVFLAGGLFAQQNGKLQLHFMDVGQGDGAVLISPQGQVVLFDAGEDLKLKSCDKPLAYLRQLGINKIDYLIISHYHFDHIGCVPEVLAQFPLTGAAYDRGASYPGDTYEKYAQSVQGHRQTAEAGQTIRLDAGTRGEVDLSVIAVNGAGDVLAALFLFHRRRTGSAPAALEAAGASVYGLLRRTSEAASREIQTVAAQDEFVAPSARFVAEPC